MAAYRQTSIPRVLRLPPHSVPIKRWIKWGRTFSSLILRIRPLCHATVMRTDRTPFTAEGIRLGNRALGSPHSLIIAGVARERALSAGP